MSMEYCYYCGEPAMDKIGCCGENHFGEMYGFKCKDLTKEYPYGVEWSFDSDGSDIIEVKWFKTEDERDIFTEEEGFNMIRVTTMNDRYSVYCEEEMADLEVNAYYLSQEKALKMAMDLLDEGKEQVTIVNMESYIKEQEEKNDGL